MCTSGEWRFIYSGCMFDQLTGKGDFRLCRAREKRVNKKLANKTRWPTPHKRTRRNVVGVSFASKTRPNSSKIDKKERSHSFFDDHSNRTRIVTSLELDGCLLFMLYPSAIGKMEEGGKI